ncbi:ATP-binding cassette domain-containing protein [Sphingomonas glaciei]|uniref:ABC transporter ATP-binding protein/permease n=1 Tax=Sphingomonas glaciei TaxID=2938948 RepID=A0ABY5MVE7_9SPHN|nr:ABC transporter ATP-binding protein [Sphingomonas glaciei]UUR08427.1 ABC transporter ATP-binding protein/permease [Sphingomonas glaciei]
MTPLTSLRLVLAALPADGQRRLWLLALATIAGGLFEFALLAALVALIRDWLDGAGSGTDGLAALLFVAAALAAGAIRYALLTLTQRLAFDTGHRLIVAVQRRVLGRDWPTHVAARTSGPLAAIEYSEQWLYSVLLPLLQAAGAAVLALGILAGLLWFDAPAALAAAGLLTLLFLASNLLVRGSLKQAGDELGDGFENRIAAVQENVGAMRELILSGARGQAAERFRRIDRRMAEARTRLLIATGLPRILVESVGLVALALVAWWLAGREGGIAAALPTLAALGLGAQRLLPLLQVVNLSVNALTATGAIQKRMAALLAEPDLDLSPPPPTLPFATGIGLEEVSFTYPGRDQPALAGIDLHIRRGERVALVGPNGSGKSTLADLVMGLLQPSHGRLLIDSTPLSRELIPAWQRNVAHVPQAPFVADTTLLANIAFMDPEPDRRRVDEAVRLTGLEDLVAALPDGLATRVGDRGQLLSGGQRQRLALARALYQPAPLLILDEATSALDPGSEAHVLRALDRLQERGTTILLIAHRETMLAGCDRIVRLESGRLA